METIFPALIDERKHTVRNRPGSAMSKYMRSISFDVRKRKSVCQMVAIGFVECTLMAVVQIHPHILANGRVESTKCARKLTEPATPRSEVGRTLSGSGLSWTADWIAQTPRHSSPHSILPQENDKVADIFRGGCI